MVWKVRSKGKSFFLVSYLVFYLFMLALLSLYFTKELEGNFISNMPVIAAYLFPISLPVLLLPCYWIIRKKIPKSIEFNQNGILKYTYSKKKEILANSVNVSFSIHHHNLYSVLILYKKVKGTAGKFVHLPIVDLTALPFPISWTPSMLSEIADELENYGYEKYDVEDKKNFILRIIG
jgi:hypothetical protein